MNHGRGVLLQWLPESKIDTKLALYSVILIIMGLTMRPLEAPAQEGIHGTANMSHRYSELVEDGKKTTSTSTIEQYRVNLRKTITEYLKFEANCNFNQTSQDDEHSTSIVPDLRLNLANDYFTLNSGYRRTERERDFLWLATNEEPTTSELWNINFRSAASKTWPTVGLNYSETRNYDHLDIQERNNKTTSFSGSIDQSFFEMFDLGYNYRNTISEDFVRDFVQESNEHDARVFYRDSFFGDTVSVSTRYSVDYQETISETDAEEVTESEQVPTAQGLFANSTPGPGVALGVLNSLIDGDLTTSTGINIGNGNTDRNIGFDLDNRQAINEIRLYTQDVSFTPAAITFNVFTSDDNLTYTQITPKSVTYDDDENFYEFVLNETTARYFKVVNTASDPLNQVLVTEIAAFDQTVFVPRETTVTERTSHNFQNSLSYAPFDWLTFDSNISHSQQDSDPGSDRTSRTTYDFSGRAQHQLLDWLSGTAQASRRLDLDQFNDDRFRDSYLLHFSSTPLDTLTADLSLNHAINRVEKNVESRNSSAALHVGAALLETLDYDMDLNLTQFENVASDSVTETQTIDNRFRAELTQSLTAELQYDLEWSQTESKTSSSLTYNTFTEISMRWAPSEIFFLNGSYSIQRDMILETKTVEQRYGLSWILTKKMQLSADYSRDRSETDEAHSFSSSLSWNVSKTFSLQYNFDWQLNRSDTSLKSVIHNMEMSARF